MKYKSIVRKKISFILILVLAFFTLIQSAAFGAEQPETSSEKEIPFPSESSKARMSLLSLNPGNIGNDNIQAQVGSDGRFNAGLKELGRDSWYNIIYRWPSGPGTSFTSLRIDGQDKIYGNYPDGQFIQSPTNNAERTMNESVWKSGDVIVRQVLQPGINPATGLPDALQMRYIITNTGSSNHEVGLRMMFDTMVSGNDSAPFKVPTSNGLVESVTNERDYIGSDVPDFWQVFNNFNNPDISAQYSMRGRDATPPDRFSITRWGAINGTKWDYQINPNANTGDSAVGMWWNPVNLAPGEQKIITTYYGRPGVGGDQALVLSGRQRLTYDEWSSTPQNLISYFTNTTNKTKNNVRLVLSTSPGITNVAGSNEQVLGTVNQRSTIQSTWRLQPNTNGIHTITIKAYADGNNVPIATAEFIVEALKPVIPPNISLGGNNGTSADGTPITGRMSPLTVNAAFDNPRAVGVTLIATDATGDIYESEMSTNNNVNWSDTFTPYNEGLWETPLNIRVIPRYADGNTGEEQQFNIVLIDPSGYIYHEGKGMDWKLPGATVVLQYKDPILNTWVNMTNEAYPGRLSPITNPLISDANGHYAWDVAAGRYRVVVSRPGFETQISREVVVPEPVTDLHVGLTPNDFTLPTLTFDGVSNGGNYTEPVTINFSAIDDAAGIRYISYQIDGNNETIINSENGTLPVVDSIGVHTIALKAVDYAGNEVEKEITFEIKSDEEPEENIIEVVTAAIEKSNEAQTTMNSAMVKINANAPKSEIRDLINNAKAVNVEAKAKVTRLKELLSTYNSPIMPPSQLELLRKYALLSELQTLNVDNKLANALELIDAEESLVGVTTRVKEAQTANKSSIPLLSFIKGNLIIFAPRN
jgi:hypothetical protein